MILLLASVTTESAHGEQGCCSGERTCLPSMRLGFDSWTCHQWVQFVVGSCPCSERFLTIYSHWFSLSSKTNISKFKFDLDLFIVKHFIMSLWLRRLCKHSPCILRQVDFTVKKVSSCAHLPKTQAICQSNC